MGLRVRKLAKELRRSPDELLGHLQTMGYVKYQSPEDMLADSVVSKLRRTLPKGDYRPRAEGKSQAGRGSGQLMDQLVPGVVRLDARKDLGVPARPKQSGPQAVPASRPAPAPPGAERAAADLAVEQDKLASERRTLAAERAALTEEGAKLTSEAERLAEDAARLKALEAAFKVEQAAFAEQCAKVDAQDGIRFTLAQAFEARGLIGLDEFERALGGMARARVLRELIPMLGVRDLDEVEQLLSRRLRLVGGEPLAFLEPFFGMVTVSDDRGELDGQGRTRLAVEALGESLLLNGISTVTLVVDRPAIFRCVQEYLDERITLRTARNLSVSDVSAQVANKSTLVWGMTVKKSIQEAAQSSGYRLFLDETVRGVVQHCERTRSWLVA
jgi:hypothetical protein